MATVRSTLFICDQCSLEYKGKKQLVEHINRIHRETRRFTCDECFKEFNKKHNLAKHISARHQPRTSAFKCQLCGCEFLSMTGLQLHHSVIHEDTKFECDTCGKLFGQKPGLLRHISVHKQERPFYCDIS